MRRVGEPQAASVFASETACNSHQSRSPSTALKRKFYVLERVMGGGSAAARTRDAGSSRSHPLVVSDSVPSALVSA